jgi:hypothetical protein
MKEIILTQGKVAIVDDDDYEWLNRLKWRYNTGYAGRTIGSRKNQKSVYMHRLILQVPDGLETDHINHDTLDNRKENLRICTRSENNCNRANKRNTSGFHGVHFNKEYKEWYATIMVNRLKKYLGNFKTAEEAARAYDKAARELHREFANLNFHKP